MIISVATKYINRELINTRRSVEKNGTEKQIFASFSCAQDLYGSKSGLCEL